MIALTSIIVQRIARVRGRRVTDAPKRDIRPRNTDLRESCRSDLRAGATAELESG